MKVFKVKNMTCAMCQNNVQKIAEGTKGIKQAIVHLESGRLELKHDHDFDLEKFRNTMEQAGYPVLENNVIELVVEDMDCPSCVQGIQDTLMSYAGIDKVEANLPLKTLKIEYQKEMFNEAMIVQMIHDLGYHVGKKEVKNDKTKVLFLELSIAAIMIFISMAPMISNQINHLFLGYERINAQIQLFLSLVILYLHHKSLKRGFFLLIRRMPNMDSLVALGSGSAFIFSFYQYIRFLSGNDEAFHHLYFESFVVILVFISLGRYLENRSKEATKSSLDELARLQPDRAILYKDGVEESVPSYLIQKGDHLVLKSGMRVPSDGQIIEGEASFDESILSGESMPLDKTKGDFIYSGTVLSSGYVIYESDKNVAQSSLSTMIDAVEQAQMEKAPIARLADEVSAVFVPIVLLIAILSFLFWFLYLGDFEHSLMVFVSVLLIACPCSLGLATPTALMVATGRAAKEQVVFRNAAAIESLAQVDLVLFDKTKTLTKGEIVLADALYLRDEALSDLLAYSLELKSEHPLAQAFMNLASEPVEVKKYEAIFGKGIRGEWEGKMIFLGSEALMQEHNISSEKIKAFQDKQYGEGRSLVYLAVEEELYAVYALEDELRPSSVSMIESLKKQGKQLGILSGDHPRTVRSIAKRLDLDYQAAMLPEEKAIFVKEKQKNHHVAMVGDGVNDAIALVQADVGIAISEGADVAYESADLVLMSKDLNNLAFAFSLSQKTMRIIRQNLFWAFAYNALGIPFAAGLMFLLFDGPFLNPMIAGLAMALSSITVVLNALRLRKLKIKV